MTVREVHGAELLYDVWRVVEIPSGKASARVVFDQPTAITAVTCHPYQSKLNEPPAKLVITCENGRMEADLRVLRAEHVRARGPVRLRVPVWVSKPNEPFIFSIFHGDQPARFSYDLEFYVYAHSRNP